MKAKITAVFDTSKIAKLANIPLTDEESRKYTEQFARILDYIDQLNSVNTLDVGLSPKDVEPTFNVSGQSNVEAKDEIGDCTLAQADSLSNAPKKQNGFFVTKGIFEK